MDVDPFEKEQPICYSGCSVYRKDYECLLPYQWLRTETIHILTKLLEDQYGLPNVKVMDPFIVSMLVFTNDQQFLLSLQKQNYLSYDYLLMPVNTQMDNEGVGSHWYLLVFDKLRCKLIVYDSLPNKIYYNTEVLKQQLISMNRLLNKTTLDISIEISNSIPQQSNSFDCGVFTVGYVQYILKTVKNYHKLYDSSVKFQCSREYYRKLLLNFLLKPK